MIKTTLFEKYVDNNLMTVGELAKRLGYCREHLSGIRSGRLPITEPFIARVCLRLGCRPGDLFFDGASETPDEPSGNPQAAPAKGE